MRVLQFLFFACLVGCLAAGEATRTRIDLREGWQYQARPDASPIVVALPHAAIAGVDGAEAMPSPQHAVAYTCEVDLPPPSPGQMHQIVIERAMWSGRVQWNGMPVGITGPGWATTVLPLRADIADRNLLRIDLSPTVGKAELPQVQAFPWHAGLVGSVAIRTVPTVHLDDGGVDGAAVWFTTGHLGPDQAEITARGTVANAGFLPASGIISVEILDPADGQIRATAQAPFGPVAAASRSDIVTSITLPQPVTWDGRRRPHRYRTRATLAVDGRVVDQEQGWLAVRTVGVDAHRGFLLNGVSYPLKAVGVHRGVPGRGLAETQADWDADIALLEELGANAVRLVHMPHPHGFLDRLDRAGFIAWSEVPVYKRFPATDQVANHAVMQLETMVRQYRHHPSIACWGLFTEIADTPFHVAMVERMHRRAHDLDPGRFTTAASGVGEQAHVNGITDSMGFIRFFGWYVPGPPMFKQWFDVAHRASPERPIGLAEFGACSVSGQRHPISEVRAGLPGTRWAGAYSEDYQAAFHAAAAEQIATCPSSWIASLWILADYRSDLNVAPAAVMAGVQPMGLVSMDRQHRKMAFQVMRAMWREDPVLALVAAPRGNDQVLAISNCVSFDVRDQIAGTIRTAGRTGTITQITFTPEESAHGVMVTGLRLDARIESAWGPSGPPGSASP